MLSNLESIYNRVIQLQKKTQSYLLFSQRKNKAENNTDKQASPEQMSLSDHSESISHDWESKTSDTKDYPHREYLRPLSEESYYSQLVWVNGDRNTCAIRAMLVAAGHNTGADHFEDTVTTIEQALESTGTRDSGEMINLGDESGLTLLALMHSVEFFDANRPVVVYSRHPETGHLRSTTATEGEQTGDPYYVFYDRPTRHYYGLQGPLQLEQEAPSQVSPEESSQPNQDRQYTQQLTSKEQDRFIQSPGETVYDISTAHGAQKEFIKLDKQQHPDRPKGQQLTEVSLNALLNEKSKVVKGGWKLADSDPKADKSEQD
jgi:hypothetical protein